MDEQKSDDQLEPIYNRSVPIQDIALKTSWGRWTIETGGERGSGRFVLAVRHDDDEDDDDGFQNNREDTAMEKREMTTYNVLISISSSR